MQIFEVTEGILAGVSQPRPAGRNTAVGSKALGGSPEYQASMAQLKANAAAQQQLSQQQAAGPDNQTQALPKASFAKNTAEYFANALLNKAGVPMDQQGTYDPAGYIAQRQGKGVYNIKQQELELGDALAREWLAKKTLNGKPITGPVFNRNDLTAAVNLANKASSRSQNVDANKVADFVQDQIIQSLFSAKLAAQQSKSTGQTPAVTPPAATKRTGGRVAGQPLSQTPNAIRKRAARLAAKTPVTTPVWKGRNKGLSKQEQDYQSSILNKQWQKSLAEDYSNLETMLSHALAAQGRSK